MPVIHVKSVTIADGANTDIVRPSDWNSAHSVSMASNELIKYVSAGTTSMSSGQYVQFGNANGLSFGMDVNAGSATITGSYTVPTQTVQTQSLIAAVYDGANSISTGTVRFSNSNGISFGINGQTITGSHNGLTSQSNQNVTAGNGGFAFQTLSFSNANGMSFGTSAGSAITGSYTVPTVPAQLSVGNSNLGNTAGDTGVFTGRVVFVGSDNITLSGSSNAGSATISLFGPAPGGGGNFSAGVSGGNTSGNTGASGTRVVFAGGNNITLSQATDANGASITVSGVNTVAQTNQTVGLYALGNTTGESSSSTFDARTVSYRGDGAVSVGFSNGSVRISAPTQTVQTQSLIAAVYDGANSISTGTIRFTNANGVSFSINGQTISGSVAAQTAQTVGLYGVGNTTQNSSTTLDARTLSFGGRGDITVGFSNGTVQISGSQTVQTQSLIAALYDGANSISTGTVRLTNANGVSFSLNGQTLSASVAAQTNQTLGLYAVSNTTGQSSSSTFDARTLSFHGAGIASVGYSAGSVVISVPAGGGAGDGVVSLGMSTEGNTAGTTGTVSSGRMIFVGSGPISLSQSLNGQSGTLSILAPATSSLSATGLVSISTNGSTISIGAGPLSFYATGNTTQSSSGTIDGRSITIQGTGGASVGVSNGSIVISGAAAGGGGATATMWQPFNEGVNVAGQHGQATLHLAPMPTPPTAAGGEVQIDRLCVPLYFSNSSNSTGSATLSLWYGLYTRNGTSLSREHSTSYSTAFTFSGTVSSATYNGIRLHTIPWTTTIPDGRYYVGMISRTTTAGGNGTLSQVLVSQLNSNFSGIFGVASNATNQWPMGWGVFNSSTTALPDTIGFSRINGTASLAARPPSWFMISSTA